MDLIFNELSVEPFAQDKTQAYKRLFGFLDTFKKSREFGFNRIRFESTHDTIQITSGFSLNDFCSDPKNRTFGVLLRGISRYPFIESDSIEEQRYIENSFKLRKDNVTVDCYGLAVAYIYSTVGIGFHSEIFWENIRFKLLITGTEEKEEDVFCVSSPEHLNEIDLVHWLENLGEIDLVRTLLKPEEKNLAIRDDHGKNILTSFANKILKSPYVIEVLNSLPFNPYQKEFIRKIKANGIIEIVLLETDEGLGLVLKTTGRTIRETTKIAEILKTDFS
jgi:hypothetical protein